MKIKLCLPALIALAAILVSHAPAQGVNQEQSKATTAYRDMRSMRQEPKQSLASVKALIAKYKLSTSQLDEEIKPMPAKAWKSMSASERFTYDMIHGEEFIQNCGMDWMPLIDAEKKIYAEPENFMFANDNVWSDTQLKRMKANRKDYGERIVAEMKGRTIVGANFKHAIIEMDAFGTIPGIIAQYKVKRADHDLLSVLNVLMKKAKYGPYLKSSQAKKLEEGYAVGLDATKANQDAIMDFAMAFYKSKK